MENTTMTKAEKKEAKKAARAERKFTKVEKSWIMYDWANSIYATNIMAAIFPIYFASVASETGNTIYGYAVSVANLIVALLAPLLGAIGDFKGMKKKLFSVFLWVGVIFTALMAFSDGLISLLGIKGLESWMLMLVGLIISRIGFSGSCLFYDSFLTDVTTNERMDRVSAWGYAMGYIGGSTIPFVISIAVIVLSGLEPIINAYNTYLPALANLVSIEDFSYKFAILIVPVWWLLFSLPFLKNVHQEHYVDEKPSKLAGEAFRNVGRTFIDICKDKKILLFIIAYFFYIDGVDTIISMATNYGSTLGLGSIGMILALLVTQIVAVPFSILFGNLGKKKGGIKMITIAVVIYFFITIIGFFMGALLDFESLIGLEHETALSIANVLFWVLATLVGTVQGGNQALSRSFFGQIIPAERSNEYYGFMDIFGKFSCVIGPALYALVFSLTGKASFGILSIIILFAIGLIALLAGKKYFNAVPVEEAVEEPAAEAVSAE